MSADTMIAEGKRPTCERCGAELASIEATKFGDTERQYIAVTDCACPSHRCPFCHARLEHDGRCGNLGCFLVGNLVPIPEWS